jgi:FtsZ-binding cell division protein ZapB
MDRIETLENKIRIVAGKLMEFRRENQRLQAEVTFLQEENQRAKQLIHENDVLRDEKKTISNRVEKLLKKINSLKV